MTHRTGIHLILSGQLEMNAIGRSRAHDRKASREAHAIFRSERLEGSHTLIMIHGQHAIETIVVGTTKESIGGIGAEGLNVLSLQFGDGRGNDLLLLFAQCTVFATTRIQRQHGNTRTGDAQVATQSLMEQASFLHNLLFGDSLRDILHGHIVGNQRHAEIVVHQDTDALAFAAELTLQIVGMTIEASDGATVHG